MIRQAAVAGLVAVSLLPAGAGATRLAGEFMAIGGGARALGMGGAFAAVAGDASTVYWNPAGLSGLRRQALAMHSERFGDLVNSNFGAYVQPSGWVDGEREGAFGVGLLHLGVDDQPVTYQLGYSDVNGNGQFDPGVDQLDPYTSIPRESDNNFALLGSFAMKTNAGRIGGTLKLIYSDAIAGESSTGIGIDLGWLYRDAFVSNLDLGAKLQDATGTYLSWSTGTNEFILPMLKLGSAYKWLSNGFNGAVLLAVDTDIFFDDRRSVSQFWTETVSVDLHAGLELQFQEKVMVRGGIDGGRYTAGAGLIVAGFLGFDYAYLHHADFDATHRVSVLAMF